MTQTVSSHSLETITSSALLLSLKQEDDAAWRQFNDRYRPTIVRYAQHTFGLSSADADDAAQSALLAFLTSYKKGEYDPEKGRLRKWLFGIATNQIKSLCRKKGRIREIQVSGPSSETDLLQRTPDEGLLQDEWDKEWCRAIFWQCFEEVSVRFQPATQSAFKLFVKQEWPASKVAAHLKISENAVFLAKHKILKAIREIVPKMEEIW